MRRSDYLPIIEFALEEDLGDIGDLTSESTVPIGALANAALVTRTPGVVAGLKVAGEVFHQVDASIQYVELAADGTAVATDEEVATVFGPARAILTAERTALNLLGRMSGVATATADLVSRVAGTGAMVSDTRKTMPGLRVLDKYSVVAGGGVNHRMGLFDAVMIKDNHLVAGMTIASGVAAARARVGHDVQITVEVETLDQLQEVLGTDADRVLLDNMDLEVLVQAVQMVGRRITTEASGGVTPENIRDIAGTGVDVISAGWITHSAPQLDIALDFRSVS